MDEYAAKDRKIIFELENFIQLDTDTLVGSLVDFAYDLEEAIKKPEELNKALANLLIIIETYKRQRSKINVPKVCAELTFLRQRFPYI